MFFKIDKRTDQCHYWNIDVSVWILVWATKILDQDEYTSKLFKRILKSRVVNIAAKGASNGLKFIPVLTNIETSILIVLGAYAIVLELWKVSTVTLEKVYTGDINP